MSGKGPCFGFAWIGQPFYSCDNCGNPFWVHTHEDRFRNGRRFRKSISRETANAVRHRWVPAMHEAGYVPRMDRQAAP